jgi:hypothetical protein
MKRMGCESQKKKKKNVIFNSLRKVYAVETLEG